MSNKKHPFSLVRIHAYIKSKIGYSGSHKVGMYALACMALKKDGLARPAGISEKEWVYRNASHINSAKIKSFERKPKKGISRSPVKTVDYRASKEFLQSYDWRRLRMQAIKQYGNKCQCCGATPATGAVINVDHIKPRRHYPDLALDLNNLQVLCHECNHGKGNWDETDWR
jgi:5-methylcytosine-specific restriction endonuclease McrA